MYQNIWNCNSWDELVLINTALLAPGCIKTKKDMNINIIRNIVQFIMA